MRRQLLIALGACALTASAWTAYQVADPAAPVVVSTPATAYRLLEARPFVLDEPYTCFDRAEQPEVRSGWVLALEVPPGYAALRNGLMPVLYVGDQVAERWNSGEVSNRVVVTVPAPVDEVGEPKLDLASALVWFGRPELPERVDAARVDEERALAQDAGVASLAEAEVTEARVRGGAPLRVRDHSDLGRALADWVERHAPDEAEYVANLRTPRTN